MKHFWIDLGGANQRALSDAATLERLRVKLIELLEVLRNNSEVVVLHCAAGLHRTGCLGYSLIRLGANVPNQLSREEAYLALKTLR